MTSKLCRTVLIESITLSDQCLYFIGKYLSETLRVAINRVTRKPTITHFIAYLVDVRTAQISRLLAIRSEQFSTECLQKLSNLKRPTKQLISNPHVCDNISNLIQEIKESINRSKELNKTELTYVSGRDVEEVVDDFTFAFNGNQINPSFLSQINIVCVKPRMKSNVVFGPSSVDFSTISDELRALLEIQTIDESENTIDGYFKVWLHDLSIDYERVRIHLSQNTGQHMNGNTSVIKCDLREAIIDANRLSIQKSGQKLNSSQMEALESIPNICETNGCYELQLLGSISRLGLCESVIFGIPYILSATRSPNLEFNELKLNCQRFQALIQVMSEKNAVFVLKQQNSQNNSPKNYFALLPSPDKLTLVMKEIASKELVLPNFADFVDKMVSKSPPKAITDSIRSEINAFPFADVYNPLFIENNLFNIL